MTAKPPEFNKFIRYRHGADRGRHPFKYMAESLKRVRGRALYAQLGMMAVLSAAVTLLAFPAPAEYQVGDVAEYTVRANRELRVMDRSQTQENIQAAEAATPPVFVLDDAMIPMLEERAADFFMRARDLLREPSQDAAAPLDRETSQDAALSPDSAADQNALAELEKSFNELFRAEDDPQLWSLALQSRFPLAVERQVISLASEIMATGLLATPGHLAVSRRQKPVSIILLSSGNEYILPSAAALMDRTAENRLLDLRARSLSAGFSQDEVELIILLSRALARPNLALDREETNRRLREARTHAPIAYLNIRAGEVIVREGSVIGEEAMEKIRAMRDTASGYTWLFKFAGLFVAMFVFFNSALFLAASEPRRGRDKKASQREFRLILLLLFLAALMAQGALVFGEDLSWDFDSMGRRTLFYAAPLSAITMLAAVFFGVRRASVIALFVAVIATVLAPTGKFFVFIYSYNGAVAATWCLANMNERGQLIPASFWVMVVNCLSLFGLTLYGEMHWNSQTAYNFLAAAASGVLSGVMASGMIPIIESAFGLSTDLKMMELGNLDRPLLRALMLSAPGTYHHSVIVGAMVEAAAEAIGANPHLARVGAYYHDIGKMKKPAYFVENQSGENRHDTLSPSMSALILIGHVKDGAELAREAHLPQAIIDIVEQHHGSSLMAFFYHKAKEQRQEGQPEINEGDFRYPGPKPRGKEASLVMLADVCEAATRSLSEHTPAKINNMVRQLVNSIFSDGQLDESDLTGREIAEIIAAFNTILIGIYHHRVAYPGAGKDAAREAAEPKKDPFEVRELYGHLPVEPPKGFTH